MPPPPGPLNTCKPGNAGRAGGSLVRKVAVLFVRTELCSFLPSARMSVKAWPASKTTPELHMYGTCPEFKEVPQASHFSAI